jgi:hypothetical protein
MDHLDLVGSTTKHQVHQKEDIGALENDDLDPAKKCKRDYPTSDNLTLVQHSEDLAPIVSQPSIDFTLWLNP